MALFRGIQEYIALDANNITLVFDSGNIVNISGNIFSYPPEGHPILQYYIINVIGHKLISVAFKLAPAIAGLKFIYIYVFTVANLF